jgi:hypothetical protein
MPKMSAFIPGLKLGELFFLEAVKPLLDRGFPDLRYSAALIGSGSEILGFDTEMSTDHHWGPRVMLFLDQVDQERYCGAVRAALRDALPPRVHGFSTNFTDPNPSDKNVQLLLDVDAPPINHRVDIFTIREFFANYLGFDIDRPLEPADWLSFPQQKLRSITGGAVYHDDLGLQDVRDRFAYYPDEVWLYLLASGWNRIGQEEHLMGRAGIVGDEIGSAIIASRLVRDIMRLAFLMERQYAPYPKWYGTAFAQLKCARHLTPALDAVLAASHWKERERHLVTAYEYIAAIHNSLEITEPRPARASNFFGRPFQVIQAAEFAEAISARISDPQLVMMASRGLIGGVDQFSDSTELLSDPRWLATLRALYE